LPYHYTIDIMEASITAYGAALYVSEAHAATYWVLHGAYTNL